MDFNRHEGGIDARPFQGHYLWTWLISLCVVEAP